MPDNSSIGRRELFSRMAGVAGGVALLGMARPVSARAATAPHVYTRAEWGARPPTTPATIISAPDHLVVHHTAFPNSTDFSLAHAFQDCPGDALYAKLPQLRDEVAGALGLRAAERATPLTETNLPRPRSLGDHGPAAG